MNLKLAAIVGIVALVIVYYLEYDEEAEGEEDDDDGPQDDIPNVIRDAFDTKKT